MTVNKDVAELAKLEVEVARLDGEIAKFTEKRRPIDVAIDKASALRDAAQTRIDQLENELSIRLTGKPAAKKRPSVDAVVEAWLGKKLTARIIQVLEENPARVWSNQDLFERVPASSLRVLSTTLSRLALDGKVDRVAWGRYKAKTEFSGRQLPLEQRPEFGRWLKAQAQTEGHLGGFARFLARHGFDGEDWPDVYNFLITKDADESHMETARVALRTWRKGPPQIFGVMAKVQDDEGSWVDADDFPAEVAMIPQRGDVFYDEDGPYLQVMALYARTDGDAMIDFDAHCRLLRDRPHD